LCCPWLPPLAELLSRGSQVRVLPGAPTFAHACQRRERRLASNVVCFFQSAQKFKTRYATFGFSDKANLDEGAMWPTAFALKELTATEEARIGALVKRAVS
jgi:hypothetical protein